MAIAIGIIKWPNQSDPEIKRAVVRSIGARGYFAAFIARQRAVGKTDEEIYHGY